MILDLPRNTKLRLYRTGECARQNVRIAQKNRQPTASGQLVLSCGVHWRRISKVFGKYRLCVPRSAGRTTGRLSRHFGVGQFPECKGLLKLTDWKFLAS